MKLPSWSIPCALRLLSLAGLASASGGDSRQGLQGLAVSFGIGFMLNPSESLVSQHHAPNPTNLSLDVDFVLQVQDHELRVPIMPLHLLGKKSWNVYNQDNIERVRRDEAKAKAEEEAEEQCMQEIDAARRMQLLRGETPAHSPAIEEQVNTNARDRGHARERKKRKRAGENDTDYEMRIAEDRASSNTDRTTVLRKSIDTPLVDDAGRIDLFPRERSNLAEKNEEGERELAKKKREYEDQYIMKFSNAAGLKQSLEDPWYSRKASLGEVENNVPSKDVWGYEDPRRQEREAVRTIANDPLAVMRQGAAQVRQVEKERRRWREEKKREMRDLMEPEERSEYKRHRDDVYDLDGHSSKRQRHRHRDGKEEKHRHRHRNSHSEVEKRHIQGDRRHRRN